MSTTHGQPGLSSEQRSTIRSTILSTRHTLEDELRRQLEKYGIHKSKRLPIEDLSHLSAEERHTRRALDAAIERELESTEGDLERSITNYVREATKTYLNRFVALKTIEVRGLVEETITERPEYGNRSYMHHTVAEIAGELTNSQDDGFSAALELAYQEIGAEIRMIFEDSEHTVIDLDSQVREKVLDELDVVDDEAWQSDEALGWVYQYFGEEERKEIDDRINEENYKVEGTDIATKTQLFTPRYIVEWMVDNSLGRTWLEMQGERTKIDDEENCFYLAPLKDSLIDREEKPVEEITVLDPACGSGHMLFYAFDVLYQMYLEEGEVPKKYIPREILQNNLYGIDIDSGAAQIAALSLYLKAKERSPEISIPRINIASADAVLVNGSRKEAILNNSKSDIEEEILESLWNSLDNLREFGSLIRIEELIDETLEEHRDSLKKSGQVEFTDQGSFSTQTKFVSSEGEEEVWEDVKNRLLQNITELAASALEKNDPIEGMFADEVEKTVEIVDLLVHDYNIVISNPPYLGSRKMNDSLKSFLKSEYTTNKDIYAAFIERNSELVAEDGYMSMVTMETFMFQYNFRKLRPKLLEDLQFVDAAHLEHRDEGYMNICYSMRKRNKTSHDSRFKRLVHSSDKKERLKALTEDTRSQQSHPDVYDIDQDAFLEIDRTPFVYWFGDDILTLFEDLPQVEDIATIYEGLSTGDDDIFIRSWWEVDNAEIGEKYRWIAMGGEKDPYYDSTEKVVLWENDGEDVREFDGSYLRNEEQYGKPGLNYKKFGNVFLARFHPEEWFFTPTSRLILPSEKIDRMALLGYLNSSVVRYIMNGLNPGVHFNINAVNNVPVPSDIEEEVGELTKSGKKAVVALNKIHETKQEFSGETLISEFGDLLFYRDIHRAKMSIAHGLIDDIILDKIGIETISRERIYSDLPKNTASFDYKFIEDTSLQNDLAYISHLPTEGVSEETLSKIVDQIENSESNSVIDLAEQLEVSPYLVAELRKQHSLYTSDEQEEMIGRLLSYIIGQIYDRWESEEAPTKGDEILSISPHSNEFNNLLRETVKSLFDNPSSVMEDIESGLESSPSEWVREQFFRHHHTNEYKRRGQRTPIYWQLESPTGAFSCLIYYHGINKNTLPKLRGQYLDSRIDELENELETLTAQTSSDEPDKELLKRKEEVQHDLDDIKQFRDTIDEMIDDGVTVDVEKGIWENIKEWDQYEVLETGLPKLKSSYSR